MTPVIYKFDINDKPWVGPPILKVLGIAFQHETLRAWCEVDTDALAVQHRWILVPTGGPVLGMHAGSVGQLDGAYVWHIYNLEKGAGEAVPKEDGIDTDVILNSVNQYDNILF